MNWYTHIDGCFLDTWYKGVTFAPGRPQSVTIWGFGKSLISGKSRLVKYWDLARKIKNPIKTLPIKVEVGHFLGSICRLQSVNLVWLSCRLHNQRKLHTNLRHWNKQHSGWKRFYIFWGLRFMAFQWLLFDVENSWMFAFNRQTTFSTSGNFGRLFALQSLWKILAQVPL